MTPANIDLKAFDDGFYRDCAAATLRPVLDALVIAKEKGVWLEVTNLVIPTLNDDPDHGRAGCAAGWSRTWDRTRRCTSPASRRATGCRTCRPRLRQPWSMLATTAQPEGSTTSTSATSPAGRESTPKASTEPERGAAARLRIAQAKSRKTSAGFKSSALKNRSVSIKSKLVFPAPVG